jgi:PAS domain S-box-containing protein
MPGHSQARDSEQLELLIDSVSDYAIFLLDASGHVATWNRGAERIKGYTADEIIGAPYERFFTEFDRERGHPADVLATARTVGRYEEEGWRVRQDGGRFWANVVMTAVIDANGTHVGYAKVTRDLTERRHSEQALLGAQDELRRSNEELDRFATIAAHDLSEPLTTVSGFAALLESRYGSELPERAQEFLAHILASTDRMQRLISTLLDYARAGDHARRLVPVGVAEACRVVVADLSASIEAHHARVEIRVDPAFRVLADQSDVELVLQNLVANAVKFGGPPEPQVRITATLEGSTCRVVVSDDGAGIAAEDQERIFGAFQRAENATPRSGTGLGLAICERIVRRLGGSMGVDSVPTEGSRFWVSLPAVA